MPKVLSSAPNAGGRHQRGRRVAPTLSEINVVPMVDVMLVLLIIFMVAAPMLQRGIEVNLPVGSRAGDREPAVSGSARLVSRGRRVFIDKRIRSTSGRTHAAAMRTRTDSGSTCGATGRINLRSCTNVRFGCGNRLQDVASFPLRGT